MGPILHVLSSTWFRASLFSFVLCIDTSAAVAFGMEWLESWCSSYLLCRKGRVGVKAQEVLGSACVSANDAYSK
jgi:hypothetical protein